MNKGVYNLSSIMYLTIKLKKSYSVSVRLIYENSIYFINTKTLPDFVFDKWDFRKWEWKVHLSLYKVLQALAHEGCMAGIIYGSESLIEHKNRFFCLE